MSASEQSATAGAAAATATTVTATVTADPLKEMDTLMSPSRISSVGVANPIMPPAGGAGAGAGDGGSGVGNRVMPSIGGRGGGIRHQVVPNNNVPRPKPQRGGNTNGMMSRPNNNNNNNNNTTSSRPSIASLPTIQSHPRQQQPHQRPPQPQPQPPSKVRHNATLTSAMMNNPPHLSPVDAVHCAVCGFAGSDLRIKGCSRRCAYHARCIDLVGLCNAAHHHNNQNKQQHQQQQHSNGDNIVITTCPHCNGPANGLEIIPLSFAELDRAQRVGVGKKGMMGGGAPNNTNGASVNGGGGTSNNNSNNNNNETMKSSSTNDMSRKRSSNDLSNSSNGVNNGTSSYPSNVNLACRAANINGTANSSSGNSSSQYNPNNSNNHNNNISSSSQCYDPTVPRTGRWTDEELAFRDAVIARFLDGSLPLSNGLKLNDFLSNMLKSKQSRLTKKMKHAKLSTKYFRIKSGYLAPVSRARELSSLESDFVSVIADPIERSEISFHMQKEWRDHLAERCTYLRIQFDANEWLRSVDAMDRRVALEKNRSRMVKRRCLMGKAMEKDVSESLPGVFIDQVVDQRTEEFLQEMEVKSRQVRSHSLDVMGVDNVDGTTGNANDLGDNSNPQEEDGDFGRFLMSMLDEAPITMNHALAGSGGHPSLQAHLGGVGHHSAPTHHHAGHHATKKTAVRSSYCDPNFRYAAPFLAGITSYMERNGVPFEHVDIWVPSTIPPALEGEGQGSMGSAPVIGEMGSGGSKINLAGMNLDENGDGGGEKGSVCRLCFAGSATLGVQIVDEPSSSSSAADVSSENNADGEKKNETMTQKIAPLTGDEIFNFSLYGDYSEKFSFSTGCGLPGRVFESGVAAWEQFLSNAPPEMFERRGGAIQFGIRTALGLPIDSPNVGRIVLVLYSKHNREKDEGLVNRMVKDVRLFNPCPRWKLVVDVRSSSGNGTVTSPVAAQPQPPDSSPVGMAGSTSFNTGMSALSMQPTSPGMDLARDTSMTTTSQHPPEKPTDDGKNNQIINLIALLQENMPSDESSPLGKQINSIMSLRMILFRPNRSPEEEQLVETILVLYESYIAAGRTRPDIALLVTRDYDFHTQHQQRVAMLNDPSPMATMQHPQQQPMMHNFNQPGPLGGPPRTTSSSGSFLPAPLVPPQQPFVGGFAGGPLPLLQNVVHPYPPSSRHPGVGMQPMNITMPQSMPINAHPSNASMPPPSSPTNGASKS